MALFLFGLLRTGQEKYGNIKLEYNLFEKTCGSFLVDILGWHLLLFCLHEAPHPPETDGPPPSLSWTLRVVEHWRSDQLDDDMEP